MKCEKIKLYSKVELEEMNISSFHSFNDVYYIFSDLHETEKLDELGLNIVWNLLPYTRGSDFGAFKKLNKILKKEKLNLKSKKQYSLFREDYIDMIFCNAFLFDEDLQKNKGYESHEWFDFQEFYKFSTSLLGDIEKIYGKKPTYV